MSTSSTTTAAPEPPLSELDREAEKLPDFTTEHSCPNSCDLPSRHGTHSIDPGPPVRTLNETEALALVVMAWNARRAGETRTKF